VSPFLLGRAHVFEVIGLQLVGEGESGSRVGSGHSQTVATAARRPPSVRTATDAVLVGLAGVQPRRFSAATITRWYLTTSMISSWQVEALPLR
jgi:hypothetical protein